VTESIALDDIAIGDRARQELGDINVLAESILEVGLLHPIVVTDSHELVAGRRRLEAFRQLGRAAIPATVLPMSPEEMLRAERDENAARLDLRRSEMVALGRKLEGVLKKKIAKAHRERGRRLGKGIQVSDESSDTLKTGGVRGVVASALGVAEQTYDRAKKVVEAAESDPEAYGDLVETMDETGNVSGTLRELTNRQNGKDPAKVKVPVKKRLEQIRALADKGNNAEQIADKLDVSRAYVMRLAGKNNVTLVEHKIGKRSSRLNPNEVVENTVQSMETTARIVEMIEGRIDELQEEYLSYWSESLAQSLKPMTRLVRKLREAAK